MHEGDEYLYFYFISSNSRLLIKTPFIPLLYKKHANCTSYFVFLIEELFILFHLGVIHLFSFQIIRRRGNKYFDVHLWLIRSVHFLSKDGTDASYEGRDGWKSCFFPTRVGILTFDVVFLCNSSSPYLYFDVACKQLCCPPREGMNGRNESTRHNVNYFSRVLTIITNIILFSSHQLFKLLKKVVDFFH